MSKAFAKNLRAYRVLANFTQEDLARVAGVTRNAVANYEAGRSEPNFEILCVFSRVLGVDVDELLSEQKEIPNYIRRIQVTDEESAVLQAYREADPVYQSVALEILRTHRR